MRPALIILFRQIFNTITRLGWCHISPVYKRDKNHNADNYCTVSLTSMICKTQDHITRSNIMDHLERRDIPNGDQHGFCSGLSTETQLLTATHHWDRDWGGQTDVLCLDFYQAFEVYHTWDFWENLASFALMGYITLPHQQPITLLMPAYGLKGTSSPWPPMTSGLPQWSVVLFLIHINDIQQAISSNMRLFADDSILYKEIRNNSDHMCP